MSKHERSVRPMTGVRQLRRVSGLLGTLGLLTACSDGPRITPPEKVRTPSALVSEPLALRAVALPPYSPASADHLVYVSLPSGTYPRGLSAIIRNTAGGPTVLQAMIDGGFDAIPVPGGVGDTILITVRDSAGATTPFPMPVPRALKPSVVRTSPTNGKRDVPLNSRIIVVFSEPVVEASLVGSVGLHRGAVPVAGTVALLAGGVVAEFVPSTLLERRTTYQLEVSQAVVDLEGDALSAPLSAGFTTGDSAVAPVTAVTVAPPTATLEMGDVRATRCDSRPR
jgi:hypothetical protein